MKAYVLYGLALLFLTLTAEHTFALYQPQEMTYLNKGLELKNQGKYQEALAIWEEARTKLEHSSLRIGRAHIELTTEQGIQEAYQTASDMYFWGLSSTDELEKHVDKEMNMLEPIVDPAEYEAWRKVFRQQPVEVLSLIQRFWLSRDFTPASSYNERLMEHWERIAHARKHFTRKDNTIYGTDDRGLAYVRFGEPDIIHEGDLRISQSAVFDLVIKKIWLVPVNGIELRDELQDGDQNVARHISNMAFDLAGPLRAYEIWVYTTHDVSPVYNNVLMFGDTGAKGFARARSINDFIPNPAAAFSRSYAARGLQQAGNHYLTPGVFIQHEYLRQLAGIDPQFGKAFSNLVFDFFRTGGPAREEQTSGYEQIQEQIDIQVQHAAPDEVSVYEEAFPSIPIRTHEYRFLDEDNNPYSIVFLESDPEGVFIMDSALNAEAMNTDRRNTSLLSDYTFEQGFQLRNTDEEIVASQIAYPDFDMDVLTDPTPGISVFRVPYISSETWQIFFSQMKNHHPDSRPEIESPFPKELRGIGTIKQRQPEPLHNEVDTFQMSDIVLGYNLDDTNDGRTLIPFTASHNKEIPLGENLAFHYELYHLMQDAGGIARLQIEFEIIEKKTGLNRLRRNDPDFILTLNQQSDQSFFRENLEVDTSELETGRYILRMSITDVTSNKKNDKDIEFSIVENR